MSDCRGKGKGGQLFSLCGFCSAVPLKAGKESCRYQVMRGHRRVALRVIRSLYHGCCSRAEAACHALTLLWGCTWTDREALRALCGGYFSRMVLFVVAL